MKGFNNFLKVLFILSSLLLVSCGGGGGSGSGSSSGGGIVVVPGPIAPVDRVQDFVDLLHEHYGYTYDSNFFIEKSPEEVLTEGFVVVYDEDFDEYLAYDISAFEAGDNWDDFLAFAEFQEVSIHEIEQDAITGEFFYYGDAYWNDAFGDFAGEFIFDETASQSKDLEKVAAMMQSFKISKVGEALAAEFGLSDVRGREIAKVATEWTKLSKSRSLTNEDAKAFSKELLGVDIVEAQNAVMKKMEGDESAFDNLMEQAANANGTTPEHMNKLMSLLIK